MHYVKLMVLAGLFLMALTLVFSFGINLYAAATAPFRWKAEGTVVAVTPPDPEDAQRVPGNLGTVIIEYKDAHGALQKGTYGRANSGGRTEFFDMKVGQHVTWELQLNEYAPGAYRYFRWDDLAKVLALFGAMFIAAALLLKLT